jgi:hypothetical protein|tara:strand:- start:1147 stop:1557 length:411 start_codon:yes stop_codon:yes gene_type:complete
MEQFEHLYNKVLTEAKKDKRKESTLKVFGDKLKEFAATHPSAKEVRAQNIKIVVAEPEWQDIRASFVGTWKDTEQSKKNVLRLRHYLGSMKNPLKVRRALNYLTCSAFRIGIITSKEISELREEVRLAWKELLEKD